jgi:hypothetical protein
MTRAPKPRIAPIVFAILAALASLAGFVALVFQAAIRGSLILLQLRKFISDGGFGSWLVLATVLFAAVATAGLGVWVNARKRAWAWTLSVPPMLVLLVGWLFEWLGVSKTTAAISGVSLDPVQKFRIMSEGISEASVVRILAGQGGCAIMAAIAAVFAARSLSRVPKAGFKAGAIGGLAGGVVGFAIACTLAFIWPAFRHSGFGFGWFPAAMAVPAAVLSGVALSDASASDEARGDALGDLAVGAVYAGLAVLVANAAVHATGFRIMTAVVAGAAIDPSQATRIAAEAMDVMDGSLTAQWLYLLPVALGFGVAAAPSLRHTPRALKTALSGAVPALVVGILGVAVLMVPPLLRQQKLAQMSSSVMRPDVHLTTVESLDPRAPGARIFVSPSVVTVYGAEVARTDALDPAACSLVAARAQGPDGNSRSALVAPDKDVAFGRVLCILRALDAKDPQTRIEFLAQVGKSSKLSAPWDSLATLTGSVTLDRPPRGSPAPRNLVHLRKEVWELQLGGKRGRIRGTLQDRLRLLAANVSEVTVTVDPDVPTEQVVQLAANSRRLGARLDIDKP